MVQLQLSSTVAVTCQFGAAARGGAFNAVETTTRANVHMASIYAEIPVAETLVRS
jgi:hypothetical protein